MLPTSNVCTSTITLPIGLTEDLFIDAMIEGIIGSPDFGVV